MKLETMRNTESGAITVTAPTFTVAVTEDAVKILIGDAVVHQWKPRPEHSDEPSPRAAGTNRKRGSR
jgi:hypothetical protein